MKPIRFGATLLLGSILTASLAAGPLGPVPRPQGKKPEKEDSGGVPWAEAYVIRSEHYEVTGNCPREAVERYSEVLEAAHAALPELFEGIGEPSGEKSRVFIVRNCDDFLELTGRPGIAGFYSPEGNIAIPARTILAYHGGYGPTGTTDQVLLNQATHQFAHGMLGARFSEAPIWLLNGTAVLFEASRLENGRVIYRDGDSRVGFTSRMRLLPPQSGIKAGKGRHIPLEILLRTPRFAFGHYHRAHAWSLVHWMLNADGGKHRSIFDALWKAALERQFTPEEVERMIEEATGHKIRSFEEKVWKPYVMALDPPPTGDIVGDKFTSRRMKMEISRPGADWEWSLDDLPVTLQLRMTNAKADAVIEVEARMSGSLKVGPTDPRRVPVYHELIEMRRYEILEVVDYDEDRLAEKVLTLGELEAVRFGFTVLEDRGDQDGGSRIREGVRKLVVVLLGEERHYEIRCTCPAENAGKVEADFDKAVGSFRLVKNDPYRGGEEKEPLPPKEGR